MQSDAGEEPLLRLGWPIIARGVPYTATWFSRSNKGYCMKLSARNVLKGKVKRITDGAVNTEVVIELPGGQEIVSVVTKCSAKNLELAVDKGGLCGREGEQRDDCPWD